MRSRWLGLVTQVCVVVYAVSASLVFGQAATTEPGSKPGGREVTMDQAVREALKNSTDMRLAAEAVHKARGVYHEALAMARPTLTATGQMTHLDQGVSASLGSGADATKIAIAKQDQKTVTVTAAMPVDIMGQISAASDVVEFQALLAQLGYNRTRNQLVQSVKAAYLAVLRAEAFVAVADQAIKNAEERKGVAEAHLNAGTGTRFDVLRAETELANARQNGISARNGVSLASAALASVMGLDQNTPLKVAATDTAAAESPSFDTVLAEAYKVRPEALQCDLQVRAANRGVFLAVRSQKPTVGLAWNMQFTPDAGAFSRKSQWAAVAQVSLPLFDGGMARARSEQAHADLGSAVTGKQAALDGIALDVRRAVLTQVEANERLVVTSAALAQAEEQYRLAQVRFKAGVSAVAGASPLLEITDAQTALTQAQTNHVNAMYDVQAARANVDRAAGRYAYAADSAPGYLAPPPGGKK